MGGRWKGLVGVAALLAVPLAGCHAFAHRDLLAIGACVVVDDHGTRPVRCSDAHTHTVVSIAARPEDCPSETDMFAEPADPHDGTTTECFAKVASR